MIAARFPQFKLCLGNVTAARLMDPRSLTAFG